MSKKNSPKSKPPLTAQTPDLVDGYFPREHMKVFGIQKSDMTMSALTGGGYGAFLVDHMAKMTTKHHLLPCPGFIEKSVFYGQGADFFAAPFLAVVIGQSMCTKAHTFIEKNAPDKTAKNFRSNWRGIRSGATLGLLAAYEGMQSFVFQKPYDTADVAAYGAGLALFLHKKDILRATVETVGVLGHQTEKFVRKTFGFREDKLV